MKLFVNNIAFAASDEDLKAHFARFGVVHQCNIPKDKQTGKSRGFGFVVMDKEFAQKAIAELNKKDFKGRNIGVREADERPSNPPPPRKPWDKPPDGQGRGRRDRFRDGHPHRERHGSGG